MFFTKNDLSQDIRSKIIDMCNSRLADAIDLQGQCKQAHWNIKGPSFIALHKLFDEIFESISDYVDLLAERVIQLGGVAHGLLQDALDNTDMPEFKPASQLGKDMCESLSNSLAAFSKNCRKNIKDSEDIGDLVTLDIMTEIARGTDKWLWFVEAHLQISEQSGNPS